MKIVDVLKRSGFCAKRMFVWALILEGLLVSWMKEDIRAIIQKGGANLVRRVSVVFWGVQLCVTDIFGVVANCILFSHCMKRIILCFLIFAIIDGLAAPAETFYVGDILYYSNGSGVAEVRGWKSSPTSLTIPATVKHPYMVREYDSETGEDKTRTYHETCTVRSITRQAFSGCAELSSIILPSTIDKIGSCAFEGCNGLSAVYISDLSAWCAISFDGYSSNPVSFAKRLFLNGSEIRNLNIPSGVTEIGAWAFRGAERIQSLSMSSDVRVIGESAFEGCEQICEINLPSSVIEIGRGAFANCHMASKLTLSDRLDVLPDSSFYSCTNLIEVTFPASVREIGENAFSYCTRIERIVIPPTVEKIGSSFNGCSNLTYATIPACGACFPDSPIRYLELEEGWEEIDDWDFSDSQQSTLETVILPASIKRIGMFAFGSCSSLKNVEIRGTAGIDHMAFSGCLNLEEVTLSADVEEINPYWFEFTGLKKINIPAGNPYLKSVDGIVYSHDGRTLVRCPVGVKHLNVRSGVTKIGRAACYDCRCLMSVDLPPSVSEIDEFAFWGCFSLTDAKLPDGIKRLRASAFLGCESYSDVKLPEGLEELGEGALSGCAMREIVIPATVLNIGTGVFSDCFELERVSWPGKSVEIPDFTFCGCRSLADFEIPSQVVSIGERAFCECDVLKEIVIPATVTHIGMSAFDACTSLEFIRFMGGVPEWLPSEDGRVIEDPYLYDGREIVARGGYGVEYKDEWEGVLNEWGLWQGLPMVCADVVPTACDWINGEIELSWYGNDVWYKLYWSTSADPDVSTNDVSRLVRPNIMSTEEDNHHFIVKDVKYLTRGDCLQPIYYHIVGTDGSWSFCKTRNRHGIFYGLAKYDKVMFPKLGERENRAESAEFFAKMMKEQGGMEKDNARCRVDGEATIWSLRRDFKEVSELVIPGDVFIFFCSTHGGLSKEGATCVALYDGRYFDNELALALRGVGTRNDGKSKDVAIINVIAACHSGGFFEIDGKSEMYLDDWYVSEQLARCSPNIAWVTSASYDSNSSYFSPYPILQTFMLYYGWQQGWASTDEYVTFGELARYAKGMVHDLMYDECKTEPQLEPELGGVLDAIRAGKRGKHGTLSIPDKPVLSYVSRGEYPDKVFCEWKGTDGADGYMLFEKRERDEVWSNSDCVLADSSCQENGYSRQWSFKKDENRPYADDKGKFHIKAYNGAGISPASDVVEGWCSWVEGKIGDLSYAYNLNADWSATLVRIGRRDGLQTGVTGLLSLPSEVDGHQVLTIAAGALRNCSEITQVTVPNTVRSLLPASFPNCTVLNTVIFNGAMPDGIEESRILDHATEVYYPQVYAAQYEKVVPAELFAGYVDVDIPADGVYTKTVNDIEWVYTIKDGIAILGYDGNSYPGPAAISTSIEGKVVIPAAFDGCPLVKIGYNAFCRCANLTEINIPDSVTEIGAAAFYGCCRLSKVDLPSHLVSVGSWAFMSCENLKRMEIPANVAQMGGSVFYSCTGLQDIIVHEGNEQFMSKDGVLFSKDGRKLIAFPGGRQEISLPPEVTKIESGAFCGSTVKHVRVPETVREFGYYVFENSFVEELELPATLTELPYCMCYGCKSLVKVVLHDGVIEVGKSTFYGCLSLNTVVIPGSVLKIESEAFAYCGTLSSVDFSGAPPSEVADDAFANVQAGCVGTYRAEHAEAWARVIDGNGMWKGLKMLPYDESVREAAVSLRNGWNWISVNVVPTDAAFASVFRDVAFAENDVIQSPDGSATYSGGMWHTNPSSFKLVAGRAYAVKKSTAGTTTVTVSGTAAPTEIAVAAGWNWIGSTATSAVSLADLVHSGGFSDGDIINSPTASATYHGGTWYGELKSIVPGSGYKARFGKAGTLRFK